MGATANVQGSGHRFQGSIGPSARRRPSTARRRPPTARRRPPTAGFTLVEMLVVIVIIGILGSLITGAAIVARNRAKRAMIRTEISQLELALTHYKQEVGEFPPDFANLLNPHAVADARNAVLRHLRKRFPRYTPVGNQEDQTKTPTPWLKLRHDIMHGSNPEPDSHPENDNGYPTADINNFDATAALIFWLGGLPETASGKPAGFHADVRFPFKRGLPRTEPLFDFDVARIRNTNNVPGFYANTDPETRPYVYFRSQRLMNAAGQYEYGYVYSSAFYPLSYPAYDADNLAQDYAVPYFDEPLNTGAGTPATSRVWRNQDTFQIQFAGFDNVFGNNDANFRFSKIGQQVPRGGSSAEQLSEGNFDNITNFTSDTIEAEMQQ